MDFSRFDYGALHEDQRARLGIGITDINGERWGYIRVREAMKFGEIVRSSKHADLVTTDPGEVSAAAAIGTDKLTTSNGFQLSNVTQDLRGAVGIITTGTGYGQQFYILENDDDTAKVFVLTGTTNRNKNSGWVVALDSTSRFKLFFPGEGRQSDGVTDHIEGIMQYDAESGDLGKFCWVKRSGLTPVIVDASDQNIADGDIVVPAGGGLAKGIDVNASGSTAATDAEVYNLSEGVRGAIGRAAAGESYAADRLVLIDLNIPDGPLSYAFARTKNGFNEVTIR